MKDSFKMIKKGFRHFVELLRQIHFFALCFSLAWGSLIVGAPILLGLKEYWDYPRGLVIFGYVVISVGTACIQILYRKEKRYFPIYIGWNFILPIVACILKAYFLDQVEPSNSGNMFAGLTILGYFIYFVLVFFLILVRGLILLVLRLVRRRKKEKMDENQYSKRQILLDVLNVVCAVGILIFLISGVVLFCTNKWAILRENKIYEVNQHFREEIQARNSEYLTEDAIMLEGYYYALAVQIFSENEEVTTTDISPEGKTQISREVLQQGIDNFRELKKKYTITRGVEQINQRIVYDGRAELVRVFMELEVEDRVQNEIKTNYVVISFDRNWNVAEIHCQEDWVD